MHDKKQYLTSRTLLLVIAVLTISWTTAQVQQPFGGKTIVTVKPLFEVPNNQLQLIVMEDFVFNDYQSNPHKTFISTGVEGVFRFEVKGIEKLSYFAIQIVKDTSGEPANIGDVAYLEPGDSIDIVVTPISEIKIPGMKYHSRYYGRGAYKLDCLEILRKGAIFQVGGMLFDSLYQPSPYYSIDFKYKLMSSVLSYYRPLISPESYDLLSVDIRYRNESLRLDNLRRLWRKSKEDWQKARIRSYLDSILAVPPTGSESARARSKYYADVFLRQSLVKHLASGKPFSYNLVYADMKNASPLVRDRLVMELLYSIGPILKERDSLAADAQQWATTPLFQKFLAQLTKNKVGDPATDFELTDVGGKKVRLSDFTGKVVFIDFWFTGCGACSDYYHRELKPTHQLFANNPNVVFITISVDRSKQIWLNSVASHQYTDPAVVNLYTNGIGQSHEIVQAYNVIGFPSPVLINQQGRIAVLQRDQLTEKNKLVAAIDKLLKDVKP